MTTKTALRVKPNGVASSSPPRLPHLVSRDWSPEARQLGIWSSASTFVLALLYVPIVIAAFVSQGNVADPIKDPYLAAMEILIILMAVPMVLMMVAVHAFSGTETKIYSLAALCFMVVAASITTSVHFVLLTVDRQADLTDLPGYSQLFSWKWPSVIYALDVAAWDWFLGLSLLLAAMVFRGPGKLQSYVRIGMLVAGTMCIAGLVGPALGNIDLRFIGEFGYWFIFPAVALFLAILFVQSKPLATEKR